MTQNTEDIKKNYNPVALKCVWEKLVKAISKVSSNQGMYGNISNTETFYESIGKNVYMIKKLAKDTNREFTRYRKHK